jgi:hypothetical protein
VAKPIARSKTLASSLATTANLRFVIAQRYDFIPKAPRNSRAKSQRSILLRLRQFHPNDSVLGAENSMVIPASTAMTLFISSLLASWVRRVRPGVAPSLVPIASGLVAGESVLGMTVALALAFGLAV